MRIHLSGKRWLYLLFITLLTACGQHPTLVEAEKLFERNYDSACILLQSIEPHQLHSRADKALYALSVTRGRFYKGIPDLNDSLIAIATGYYNDSDPQRAALAWFYLAKTCALTERYDEQVAALLKAQQYGQGVENCRLPAYIHLDRATLFENQQQPDSAVYNYRLAIREFRAQKDSLNALTTELQLAGLYSRLHHTYTAERICRRLLQQQNSVPVEYSSAIYRTLGSIYHLRGDYRQATQVYLQTPRTGLRTHDDNLSYLIAKSYCADGQYDSAAHYLSTITDFRVMATDYYKLWMKVHRQLGNHTAAMNSMEQAAAATDSLYSHRLSESFAGLEKKFNYQQLQLKNQKLEINHFRTKILVMICLFGIASLATMFYIYRSKAKMKLLEQRNLSVEKERENAKLMEHQLVLHKIVITNLEQYRNNTHRKREQIKEGFSPVNNEHFFHELYSAIDIEYNQLSKRLRTRHTDLNENDILICCLILAGFDTGMMASIFNIKYDSMNVRRSRLRKKLNLDNSVNFIEYLRHF